jgi:putative transposase
MLRAYKTELNLNNKQSTQFLRYAGTARFVFNWALADHIERHKQGLTTNKFEQKRRFNALKKEAYSWIYDVAYTLMAEEFDKCDMAFQNFFRRVKKGEKPGFPKFKSKKNGINSFTLRGNIKVESSRIKLPRIGWLRLKEDNYLPVKGVKVLSANISNQAGHWFISLQVETQQAIVPLQLSEDVIGVDLGIKVLATCSNGKIFENPKSLSKYEATLAHKQRELCRRVKGSKNRAKTKKKIAKLHYRIGNIRRYALNEVSNYLTVKAKPKVIVLENLNVKGMTQNHHLAKAISDASFAELRRQVEYKSQWYGEKVLIADRFYPSSKTCSECGSVKPLLKLSERTFVCESCGAIMDRDFNASLNLASLAV